MRTKKLGNTGLEISRVAFGGIVVMDETTQEAADHVAWAVEHGVNYFDVAPAPSYGNAQEMLGPALEPYRKSVSLACKTGMRDAAGAERELTSSLKVMRTDYFDVYQLHAMSTMEDVERVFADDGAMNALIRAKQRGLIRRIGMSAHREEVALEALKRFDFDTVMFPLNWALGLSRNWGERLAKVCAERGIGLLAIKGLAHRMWHAEEERVYPKSWCKTLFGDEPLMLAAMRYTLAKGADALIPPGNFEQFAFMVEHIDECLDKPLTEADIALLRAALPDAEAKPIFD